MNKKLEERINAVVTEMYLKMSVWTDKIIDKEVFNKQAMNISTKCKS